MANYIPLEKTVSDFQKMLKTSALTGNMEVTLPELIQQLRDEPLYNVSTVLRDVQNALIAPNELTNCVTGNDSEHVVVTKAKLEEVLNIIRNGGRMCECQPE